MLEEILTKEWEAAFSCAGSPEPVWNNWRHDESDVSARSFDREHVETLIASSITLLCEEGSEDCWYRIHEFLAVCKLDDGRFAFIAAQVETADDGWMRADQGNAWVGSTFQNVIRFALGSDDRERLGLEHFLDRQAEQEEYREALAFLEDYRRSKRRHSH